MRDHAAAAAAATRWSSSGRWAGLLHAVPADHRARPRSWSAPCTRWCPPGRLRTTGQVGGLRRCSAVTALSPALPGAGPPDRRRRRRRPRRRRPAGRVPAAGAQRRLPGAPTGVGGRRTWTSPGTAARRSCARCRTSSALIATEVKPFGLDGSGGSTPLRITVKGDAGRDLRVRQAVRGHARALRPLVQARPHAAVRPARGREGRSTPCAGWSSTRTTCCGCCTTPGCRCPQPLGIVEITPEREYLLVTEFFDGAQEIGDAEVDDVDHRPGAARRPPDVGDRAGAPRHQAGQPAGPRRPAAGHRLRVRRGAAQPVAAGGRPRQHDAGPGAAHRRRAGVRAGAAAVLRRGDRRGLRRHPRADHALAAAAHAARAGPRPARRVPGAAALPAAAGPHPALELAAGRADRRRRSSSAPSSAVIIARAASWVSRYEARPRRWRSPLLVLPAGRLPRRLRQRHRPRSRRCRLCPRGQPGRRQRRRSSWPNRCRRASWVPCLRSALPLGWTFHQPRRAQRGRPGSGWTPTGTGSGRSRSG